MVFIMKQSPDEFVITKNKMVGMMIVFNHKKILNMAWLADDDNMIISVY